MPPNASAGQYSTPSDPVQELERQRIAFEELTLPHLKALYNFARWMARNPEDAEDLVQETYLKAFRTFGSFRTGSNVRAWLFKILKNTHLNVRSRLDWRLTVKVDEGDDLANLAVDPNTPETMLERNLHGDTVRRLIEQLPEQFKEVLVLREVEELSYQQIADILSVPLGTVMSRLSRSRRILREWLTATHSDIRR